jgi:chromosome segregation ATPase
MSGSNTEDAMAPAATEVAAERIAIERLEARLAEEQQRTTALRSTVEELTFKLTVLEKSYATQLAAARAQNDTLQKTLDHQRAEIEQLTATQSVATQALTTAQADIARLTADRDRVSRELAVREGLIVSKAAPVNAADLPESIGNGEATSMEALIRESEAVRRWQTVARPEATQAREEEPVENMIDPELVFPRNTGKTDTDD